MLSNPVSAQFKKAPPVVGHIVAIEVLHENVQKVYDDALAISKTIIDIGTNKLQPPENAKFQVKLAEEGLKLAAKGLEETENVLKILDGLIAGAEKAILSVAKTIDENPGLITGWSRQLASVKDTLAAHKSGLEGLRDAVRAASKVVDEFQRVLDAAGDGICKSLPFGFGVLCQVSPAYNSEYPSMVPKKCLLCSRSR